MSASVVDGKNFFSAARSVIGIVVSAFLLWQMISNSRLESEQLRLSYRGWLFFSFSIAVFIATIWLQSLRVKLLWRPRSRLDTYRGLLAGNFYNSLLPGNLGEGIRAIHLSRKNNIPLLRSLASQLIEKYIDAFTFILLCFLWYALFGYRPHAANTIILITCFLCFIVFSIGLVFLFKPRLLKTTLRYLPLPRLILSGFFTLFLHTRLLLLQMINTRMLIPYFLFGAVLLAFNTTQYYLVILAIPLPADVANLACSYYLALCMVIIAFIPAAPGNTGVLHYGLYTVLVLLSTKPPSPLTLQLYAGYTILHHLSIILPELVLGGVVVVMERKTLF